MSNFKVVHVVKRFGPVGGMELYVWRLVNGLSAKGLHISVICEQVMAEVSPDIDVIQVEKSPEKPRWKSMLIFRDRVDALLKERFRGEEVIIHSHERSLSHQVTTFHGPPISAGGNLGWIKRLSPRIRGWKRMERHELLSPSVQCVVSVSTQVQEELIAEYPGLTDKFHQLGWPGVDATDSGITNNSIIVDAIRFIFAGKEWKRKGLLRAIAIVDAVRKTKPSVTLDVYGVERSEILKVVSQRDWVRFKGWVSDIPWAKYDILVHPAEEEPFGMVIAEARANGVAVLMSNRVGASDLGFDNVRMVGLRSPLGEWLSALDELLVSIDKSPEVKWTWSDLVNLHCQVIYPKMKIS